MRTVSADKVRFWITPGSCISSEALANSSGDEIIPRLSISNFDMTHHGWVEIGFGQVSLNVKGNDEIIGGQVEALKAQKQKVIADAEVEANQIEKKIQQLLAITYEPA